MAWLYLTYEPVSAFTLRPSNSTSTGGKTLVVPTPYAIKMAVLDRLIRLGGVDLGKRYFSAIRDLVIYLRPPQVVAINRTFQKVLRNYDSKVLSWTQTISQIEFCLFAGVFELAVEVKDERILSDLSQTFSAINYFGKRGGFMQLLSAEVLEDAPHESFVNLSEPSGGLVLSGFLQRMDEMLPNATFEDISIFNPKAKGGRKSYTTVLPYSLDHHGTNHTVYVMEGR